MRRAIAAFSLFAAGLPLATMGAGTAAGWDGLDQHIPADMLAAYRQAAATFDIDWAILAAVGKLECDHGRSPLAGCNPPGTTNHAGARGPMQFLGSTWRHSATATQLDVAGPPVDDGYGYATDGDGDGIADPWNRADAAHAAARYLADLGVRDDPWGAARSYNAGPANPDPDAGAGCADPAIALADLYRQAATQAGTPAGPAAPAPSQGGGCTVDDPTGTGGCVTPTAAHLADQITLAFGSVPVACWGHRPTNPSSDHPNGRACDVTIGQIGRMPTPAERAHGWTIADWLVANADPLQITYLVWDGQLWTTAGWRTYQSSSYDVTTPTGGHYDHVHISVAR